MTIDSRKKGKAAELEVAEAIRDAGWKNARRTSDGRTQTGRGDIANGPVGIHIEIKRVERLNVPAAFDQIRRDCPATDAPMLIHRPSRCEWMCTMELDEVLALLALRELA